MSIILRENPYKGVNPHFQSSAHTSGDWEAFHGGYILSLTGIIDAVLPEGYIARAERSLQVRVITPDDMPLRRTKPDITISSERNVSTRIAPVATMDASLVQTIADTFAADDELLAIVIRDEDSQPVVRIEIISPSNTKGDGLLTYQALRRLALDNRIVMIDVDFLHAHPSPIYKLPQYPDDAKSTAYAITMSIPRPTLEEGIAATWSFGVDDPIPTLTVPLRDEDLVKVDFGSAYHQTLASLRQFWGKLDYSEPPADIAKYSKADQQGIRDRMKALAE